MLKKHLIFVMLLVLAAASAQASTWKMHNYYVASKIQNIYDTGDKVYYLNSMNLYMFDKATTTTVALGKQNLLSDSQISQIYYDCDQDLLFVAYTNANIDIIDADGKVTNISNIKDAVVRVHNPTIETGELKDYSGKTINDITFANGLAYVTLGYGYVVIDESTKRVIDSVELGQKINVNTVGMVGDRFVIITNAFLYYGEPGQADPIHTYAKTAGSYTGCKMFAIDDNAVFLSYNARLYRYDFTEGAPTHTTVVSTALPTSIQRTTNGFIANFAGEAYYYTIDATGTTATKAASVACFASSDPNGDGTVWINDGNGIHINGSSTNYKMNTLTTYLPYWLKYNASMNRLYAATSAPNIVYVNSIFANVVNTYDGNQWSVATPYTGSGSCGYEFVFNPLDPTMYVRASWDHGLYKVVNNTLKTQYTYSNSPLGKYKPHPAFDNYGNLWAVCSFASSSQADAASVAVLPQRYVSKATATKSDWFVPTGLNLRTGAMQRSRFLVAHKNNVKIYSDCDFPNTSSKQGFLLCFDNNNEDPTVDTYRLSSISHFVDQNNKQIDWVYLCHMEEDQDGLIWVGHTMGLFVFDPTVVFNEHPTGIRPYTAKSSEGKGYLCEGYSVFDIGVDRHNNKWLASNNGVYFVSPDGSEIYNHFTTENSDLPSNSVYSVECDTVNDRVYIFTDNGFAEYVANGDAASLSFDNVYAFPNPVEPDFTGMVKIAGLMENSYVTVTDREGNIVAQMGPVMGAAFWDASNANGERVPTGIYNIYAAQGAQPAITGTPHATVMIIK